VSFLWIDYHQGAHGLAHRPSTRGLLMSIASQVADVLRDTCPGLSAEATAIALGIDLRPADGARYRFMTGPSRVEYDSQAIPAAQQSSIQRAIVLHVLNALELRLPRQMSLSGLVREVFEPTASAEAELRAVRQR
jgi:hypothetical protein